ncbi:hypothetical protein Tco_0276070 [Tanacetum coccineum]
MIVEVPIGNPTVEIHYQGMYRTKCVPADLRGLLHGCNNLSAYLPLVSRRKTEHLFLAIPPYFCWNRFARLSLDISSCLSGSTTVSRVRLTSVEDAWSSGIFHMMVNTIKLLEVDIESSRFQESLFGVVGTVGSQLRSVEAFSSFTLCFS